MLRGSNINLISGIAMHQGGLLLLFFLWIINIIIHKNTEMKVAVHYDGMIPT